ncbi:MAG: biotin-dependent carboxyltransferase family protein [Flavobacteriaceae bacterium]
MIEIVKSGLYTTIQDLGRFGYENYGVPISGSMDQLSSILSNKLLGNNDNDAVMEITMTGPVLKFLEETKICITGADISPSINDNSIDINRVYQMNQGDILKFGKLKYGLRSYIGVSGGFLSEKIMNSRSMHSNITKSNRIIRGESLNIKKSVKTKTKRTKINVNYLEHFKNNTMEVFKGPEFNKLTIKQKQVLLKKKFTISNNNDRMAYQLNESFNNQLNPIITSLVMQGTVQLTPSGKIIILMRDCQTCGGYPRILQVSKKSINKLSQKHMGNGIKFKLIDL